LRLGRRRPIGARTRARLVDTMPSAARKQLARREVPYLLNQFISRRGPAYERYALLGEHLANDT